MTPDTFMSISQKGKAKSRPNKLGWKTAFHPRATAVTSALQLDCFQLSFLWVASLQAQTQPAGTGFTWDLNGSRKKKKKKKISAKPNRQLWFSKYCVQLQWYSVTKASFWHRKYPLRLVRLCHFTEFPVQPRIAHIPYDHSCVWHFKEDYENEMW